MRKFFYGIIMFCFSMMAIFVAFSLSSCKFAFPHLECTESVIFNFPQWPPEYYKNELETAPKMYPQLAYWSVEIITAEGITVLAVKENFVEIEVNKNEPLAVLATPVTLTTSKNEAAFFKPCGSIYPYEFKSETQQLTWTGGYTAHIFKNLYESKKETGVTAEHMEQFLQSFNWKKFQSAIEEKSSKIVSYNPWMLDSYELLDSLSYSTFKQNLLDVKNIASLSFSSLGISYDETLLSPYIPENAAMRETGKITVKKGEPTILSYNTDFVLIILYTSAKNVSLEYVFMPIFLQEI